MAKSRNVCPLLKYPDTYDPDTIDLLNNAKERNYWLPCLENMVQKFVNKASYLNPDSPTANERAKMCLKMFHELVEKVNSNPMHLTPLSIRTLLEFNEQFLRDNNFEDAWIVQKEKETAVAFLQYKNRIEYIDSITNFKQKWTELATGLIAGNVFDWGARAISDILEVSNGFGLSEALSLIQNRPWFRDNLDEWIDRLKKQPYRTAVIFTDNAGVDFVLGVLPLIRQLLLEGTNIMIAANSNPALNDVTFKDLQSYLQQATQVCSVINGALVCKRLLAFENGQSGPCLDLSSLNSGLCQSMYPADLIILEGMGRAVHTNLNAEFKVDCLKLAVLKNEWLAKGLGAEQFSVIFQYECAPDLHQKS